MGDNWQPSPDWTAEQEAEYMRRVDEETGVAAMWRARENQEPQS